MLGIFRNLVFLIALVSGLALAIAAHATEGKSRTGMIIGIDGDVCVARGMGEEAVEQH